MARHSRSSVTQESTFISPAGMGADALRVTCEGTRALPTATGGTLTIDLFTLLCVIFACAMMAIATVLVVVIVWVSLGDGVNTQSSIPQSSLNP